MGPLRAGAALARGKPRGGRGLPSHGTRLRAGAWHALRVELTLRDALYAVDGDNLELIAVQRLREAPEVCSLLELMLRLRRSSIELSGGTSSPAIAAAQSV